MSEQNMSWLKRGASSVNQDSEHQIKSIDKESKIPIQKSEPSAEAMEKRETERQDEESDAEAYFCKGGAEGGDKKFNFKEYSENEENITPIPKVGISSDTIEVQSLPEIDKESDSSETVVTCTQESNDEYFCCSDDDTDETSDSTSSSSGDTEDAMSEIINEITRDENVYPWLESISKNDNKIELVVKLQSKEKAQKYISDNFKENELIFNIEEGDIQFLVKDWELKKGAKVQPYQNINICEVVQEGTPLPRIEKICKENYGYGTLGCFAKNEEGQPFAITAQHVLSIENRETNKNRYIFSEVTKQEQGVQSEHTIMLSICSSGLLNVECIREKDIYLDIAMMKLSDSLIEEHGVQIKEELHVAHVRRGVKVYKFGTETGETAGTVSKVWYLLNNEFSEGIRFGKVFTVKGDGREPFAEGGDSGCLIYTWKRGNKCALGILSKCIKDSNGSLLNGTFFCVHLKYCMEALKGLGSTLTLYDGATGVTSTNGTNLLSHRDVYEHHKCPYKHEINL